MKLTVVLSLCGVISATSKSVLIKDNGSGSGQLMTSSLLTWESFKSDPNQFKHAVVGGTFMGEDVSRTR